MKIAISLIVGIILSGGGFFLAFKNVPFSDLKAYLNSVNYFWIIPSSILVVLTYILRVIRWRIILSGYKSIDFWSAFHPLMIGFMLNYVLPARIGEIARPIILQKEEQVPFSTGIATVTIERLFDSILLITLLPIILSNVYIDPKLDIAFGNLHLNKQTLQTISSAVAKICAVIISIIALICINKTRKIIIDLTAKLPTKISVPVISVIENFASGLSLFNDLKNLYLSMALSIGIWLIGFLSYYVMIFGCPGVKVSFIEISATVIIICYFIALPSAPGYWGLWEAGGVFGLALFGVSQKDAAGFTLINHFIQIVPIIIIGFVSAIITGAKIWQLSYEKQ
ncbi:MAG: flippase-like domain-containing protein [Desulfobacterales bacterium]|nr:flippase-like domain-containing protein [Desulfobacterales bacterium]MBF0395325.1 flippase-like domain-containing protein [Desulfobacterales bacterium]